MEEPHTQAPLPPNLLLEKDTPALGGNWFIPNPSWRGGEVQLSGRAFDCKILHLEVQREIAVTDKSTWNEARKETLRDRQTHTDGVRIEDRSRGRAQGGNGREK